MTPRGRAWFCLVLSLSGCAHHVGRQSTSGALAEVKEQIAPEPGQTPAEAVARRATNGVLNELNEPEQKERMDAMIANAADSFRAALTRGLTADLGANGDGPLAQSFAALAERSAARAAQGAMTTMLAGCDPEDPTCLDRRVTDLSTRAAIAVVDGVKHSLGLAALAIAFGAGAASMLLLGVLWRLTRRLSDSSGTPPGSRRRAERPAFDHPRPQATSTT